MVKDTDMVVIPCTSVLYPHYEGPRDLYLNGGQNRLKINNHLKEYLVETKKRPMEMGECHTVDPEDLKKKGI